MNTNQIMVLALVGILATAAIAAYMASEGHRVTIGNRFLSAQIN